MPVITTWAGLGLRTLQRHRRRALGMMAGIVVGVGLLGTVNAVSDAAQRTTMAQVKNMLGTFDTVLVRPGAGKTRGMVSLSNVPPTLTFDDADAIGALPDIRQAAKLQNALDIGVQYRDRQDTPAIFGVSANWLDLRGDLLARGKFFDPGQMSSEARIAVVGGDVVRALFAGNQRSEDPIGQTIRLGDVPFQIQGVLARRGAGPGGFSLDDIVLIPITTARRRLFNRDFLTMVVAQVNDPGASGQALSAIRTLLRQRHHVAAAALDDFTLTDPSAVAAQLTAVRSRLELLVRGAAWLALGLGAVAIVTLMLLGISERRAEIAVRRATGASRGAILGQFVVEAALLSLGAAVLGWLLAVAGVAAAARWQHQAIVWPWGQLAGIAVAAFLLGVASGLIPAWLAARLDPAVALRA
ncbi:MAG: ABC transporter permease [Terriglobales bacterium]